MAKGNKEQRKIGSKRVCIGQDKVRIKVNLENTISKKHTKLAMNIAENKCEKG